MVRELWLELGRNMRVLREARGLSLRQAETDSGWGRSTLSQVENGKARPSRALVEWYDDHLDADGMLLAIYGEARAAASGHDRPARYVLVNHHEDDDCEVVSVTPATGSMVPSGGAVDVRIAIRNTGSVPWVARQLCRVGSVGGARLITSARSVPVPRTLPGELAEIAVAAKAPVEAGTAVAYWCMADDQGMRTFPDSTFIHVALVVSRALQPTGAVVVASGMGSVFDEPSLAVLNTE